MPSAPQSMRRPPRITAYTAQPPPHPLACRLSDLSTWHVGRACERCNKRMEVEKTGTTVLTCDGRCGKAIGVCDLRWSCAACDFDLCEKCSGEAQAGKQQAGKGGG
eukprot:231025-Prymnesium_polylepis.1